MIFKFFIKKRHKTKQERIDDFRKDFVRVYVKHSDYLSPKEMSVLSKDLAKSPSRIGGIITRVRSS